MLAGKGLRWMCSNSNHPSECPSGVSDVYRRTVKWELLELSQGSSDCFRVASRSLPVGGIPNALSVTVLAQYHINSYTDSFFFFTLSDSSVLTLSCAQTLYPLRRLHDHWVSLWKKVCNQSSYCGTSWQIVGKKRWQQCACKHTHWYLRGK